MRKFVTNVDDFSFVSYFGTLFYKILSKTKLLLFFSTNSIYNERVSFPV